MENSFRSRVSVVLLLIILISFVPILFVAHFESNEKTLAIATVVGSAVLVAGILVGIRYEIGEELLAIKIGPILYGKIKLKEIETVKRSYIPLSAPASSLKRLMVSSGKKDMLISPVREKEFIRLLLSRNPNIKVSIDDKNQWFHFWNWDL